jgi:hypothetical protein
MPNGHPVWELGHEVLFLTYDIVHPYMLALFNNKTASAQEQSLNGANFAERPHWSMCFGAWLLEEDQWS